MFFKFIYMSCFQVMLVYQRKHKVREKENEWVRSKCKSKSFQWIFNSRKEILFKHVSTFLFIFFNEIYEKNADFTEIIIVEWCKNMREAKIHRKKQRKK